MEKNKIVLAVLNKVYRYEVEAVGLTNLQDIVNADVDFVPVKGGSYTDLADIISVLVVATTFIKTVLEIYEKLKKEIGRKPKKEEIEIRISGEKKPIIGLDGKSKQAIIDAIFENLESE